MQKTTPLARAVRTFMFLMASSGVFAAIVQIDWFEDFRSGAILLGVAAIGSFIGAVAAFVLAQSESYQARVQTPFLRALVTALQQLGGGLAAIVVVNLDPDVLVSTGKQIGNLVGASVVAFVLTYFVNASEDRAPVPGETARR